MAQPDGGLMTGVPPDDDVAARTSAARRILAESVLLGVLADGALRNAPAGLGWTIFVLALALAALNVAWRQSQRVGFESKAWLAVAVSCAAAFAWRDSDDLRAFNVLGTLVALALFAQAAARLPAPSILAARLRDVIAAGVYTLRDFAAGAPMVVARDAELQSLPAVRGGASWTAIRALLLTAPVVLVFTVLLSRADPVFASVFSLPEINAERLVEHAALMGVFTWLSAGWMRGALLGTSRRVALPEHVPVQIGLAEVTTSLGSVIVLFTVFVALQARWLFGGADIVLATTGLTVAEYARRGFFELVAVAALVIPLILGTRAVIHDDRVAARHRHLSLALLVLLGAIMASALLRMRLYVWYFGLTTDRLVATAIMGWLGLVAVSMAVTVFRGWTRPFAAMTVLSAFLTLFVLNLANPDRLVASVNLGRVTQVRGVDYEYLARLSGDAVPNLVNALQRAEPSPEACAASGALRRRWVSMPDVAWNVGARRGHRAVIDGLPPTEVLRLCAQQPR